MSKKRLGFDLDGVLYPWQEIIYNYAVNNDGETRNFHDFWREATEDVFTTGKGRFWLHNNLFYTQRDIKPSILDTLYYLDDIFDLFYVTARVKTAWRVTRHWFERNKLPRMENLYFTEDEKLSLILLNEIDIFVEDRIKHILELRNHTRTIMVRQPHNEELWNEAETIDSVVQLPEVLGV